MMTHIIDIQKLKFNYDLTQNILNIDELKIAEGEKVFLYGPSGLGKSTLLNIIAGVLKASSGDVNILGQNFNQISQGKRDKIRGENIGYIFQNFNLIPYLNIKDNITLPCRINPNRSHSIDYVFQADEIIESLGLTEHVLKNVTDLSIGQQQRVAAARALIGNPKLVIADEPTSSLDEKNTEEFMKLLIKECDKRKFTLLFVSHDSRLQQYFSRSLSLSEINKA